jgi:hypothetical protein
MDLLMTVGAKMVEEPYKLLIVDSIMALFRCATRHGDILGYPGHPSVQNWARITPVVHYSMVRYQNNALSARQLYVPVLLLPAGLTSQAVVSWQTGSRSWDRCWRCSRR